MNDLNSNAESKAFLDSLGGVLLTKEDAQKYIKKLGGYVGIAAQYGFVVPESKIGVRKLVIGRSSMDVKGNILGFILDTKCSPVLVREGNEKNREYIPFEDLPEDMQAFFEKKELKYSEVAFDKKNCVSQRISGLIILSVDGEFYRYPKYYKQPGLVGKKTKACFDFSEVQKMPEEELRDLIKNHFDRKPGDFLKMVDRNLDIFETFESSLLQKYVASKKAQLEAEKAFCG